MNREKQSERFSRLINSYMFQMRPERSPWLLFENLRERDLGIVLAFFEITLSCLLGML